MTIFVDQPPAGAAMLPSVFEYLLPPATQARRSVRWRRLAMLAGMVAVPAAAGIACARATTPGRGLLAGGIAAVVLGALRVELARWFTPEPAFEADGTLGKLHLRRYATRVEAAAEVDEHVLEDALDHGYRLLAEYTGGANQTGESLSRTTPILTAMRDGRYSVAFVMPPGLTLGELPRPVDPSIVLREVPARTIAALRFHGRFTRDNIAAHERVLLQQLVDSGLAARGSVTFAAFDPPVTLPILRRNELWIEIV